MFGGDRNRLAKAQFESLIGPRLASPALGLVGADDHRLVPATQKLDEHLVQRSQPVARIHHEQGHVAFVQGQFGLGAHPRLQALVRDVLEPGGVDQGQIEIAQAARRIAPVAGYAGPVIDDRQLLAGQPVEQRRFADVRPADNGQLDRHDEDPAWVTGLRSIRQPG